MKKKLIVEEIIRLTKDGLIKWRFKETGGEDDDAINYRQYRALHQDQEIFFLCELREIIIRDRERNLVAEMHLSLKQANDLLYFIGGEKLEDKKDILKRIFPRAFR